MVTRTRLNVTFICTMPVFHNSRLTSTLRLISTETTPEKSPPPPNNMRPSILILRIMRPDMVVACKAATSVVRLVSRGVALPKIRQTHVRCNRRLNMHHDVTIARSENEARPTDTMWMKCGGLFRGVVLVETTVRPRDTFCRGGIRQAKWRYNKLRVEITRFHSVVLI